MKKHSKSKKKIQAVRQYFIPMTKNQLQRKSFQLSVHEWVDKKFDFVRVFIQSQIKKDHDGEIVFKKKCKQLQSEFILKHKLEGLIYFLPLDYYKIVIKYVMEKKLSWTFKMEDTSQVSSDTLHKNTEVQLALELKKYYKHYEYNQKSLNNTFPHSNRLEEQQIFLPNNTSIKSSFRKCNPDFLYDLLMMLSVSVVASFFQHFFPQLQIDKVFRSEIYIIINHGFLDIEVSPSVYDVMQKKHCTNNHARNFQSLNANYLHQFSGSFHKSTDKNMSNLESKRTIGEEKIKSTVNIGSVGIKTMKTDGNSKQTKHVNASGLRTSSSKRLFASNGFQNNNIQKPPTRNGLLIKPSTSIGGCLPSDRLNNPKSVKSYPNMQASRFNSFIKDTKQIPIPAQLQEAIDNGYLPTNEEIDFYATVRNCLYVDALPPIKKKKMNIYQYEKLNEVDKIEEIKKQIKSIDQQGKKQHLMSNDISLAMNTFISTSSNFPRKKKIPRDFHISTQHNQPHFQQDFSERKAGMKSLINAENKQNFELKKLPLKASILKFQLTKSCNFYTFDQKVLKIGQNSQRQQNQQKTGITIPPPSVRKINEPQKIQRTQKFIQRNKKSSTQTVDANQFAKSTQLMNETMSLRQSNKRAERKRYIERRKYSRDKINDLHKIGSSFDIKSATSFKEIQSKKSILGLRKKVQKNEIQDEKLALERQSILNGFDLSAKLQKFELGTKEVTEVEVLNQNTNRSDDCFQCGVLEGQVNVQKDSSINSKSKYKSFELRKRLKDFEINCKKREEIAHYSMFHIRGTRDPLNYGPTKHIEQEDDQESKGRPSLSEV